MWCVESVRVHIAVLSIMEGAGPCAASDVVNDCALAAGHHVRVRASVRDNERAIRDQLARWINDTDIDVVVVTSDPESQHASAGLRPLVTEAIPGFTDLFRWLAFQEVGASAMTSSAEAAHCGASVVFVLPAAPQ